MTGSSDVASAQVDHPYSPGPFALKLTNVSKSFGAVRALSSVSLEVQHGHIHALVGENGAGKSTMMALASGSLAPDDGGIELCGIRLDSADPARTRELGLAVVHQEPALLPDLTVAENFLLALPVSRVPASKDVNAWVESALEDFVGSRDITPQTPVRELSPDGRFVVEIARAFAAEPAVLILDEPTEHLGAAEVDGLFARLRSAAESGTAIIYISHRIREVLRIADDITVLRDGSVSGHCDADSASENELVDLIVGRSLGSVFPAKSSAVDHRDPVNLEVSGLSNPWFTDITFSTDEGEIVGLAGIEGNGQREVLRALAGLIDSTGSIRVLGTEMKRGSAPSAVKRGMVYIPSDRRVEGSFGPSSVAENVTAQSLRSITRGLLLSKNEERAKATSWMRRLAIKTPSIDEPISSLSGGNQQKVMLARALSLDPAVILADEPSQGVDVGARSAIYEILRRSTSSGATVVVVSSDATELAGLCDRVLVFSRGVVVAELRGDELSERAITAAGLTATTARAEASAPSADFMRRASRSDLSPAAVLACLCLILGGFAAVNDPAYLTARNVSGILTLVACLGAAALGQQLVLMAGGIDLSIGPLMGLLVVVASFTLAPGTSVVINAIGWAAFVIVALCVGVVNWFLIGRANVSPLIATLITYTALQGISLILRPVPEGQIARPITDALSAKIGVVPIAVVLIGVLAVGLEYGLRRRAWGRRLRGYGSNPETARAIGVPTSAVLLGAYVGGALFAALGAILLLSQVGSGDSSAGTPFTLLTISAAVLGGAKLGGGRGSFIGALLGALLIQQINTVITFMQLDAYLQQYLVGALTLTAVGLYSRLRAKSETGESHAH